LPRNTCYSQAFTLKKFSDHVGHFSHELLLDGRLAAKQDSPLDETSPLIQAHIEGSVNTHTKNRNGRSVLLPFSNDASDEK
jgi:hypothetical protein